MPKLIYCLRKGCTGIIRKIRTGATYCMACGYPYHTLEEGKSPKPKGWKLP